MLLLRGRQGHHVAAKWRWGRAGVARHEAAAGPASRVHRWQGSWSKDIVAAAGRTVAATAASVVGPTAGRWRAAVRREEANVRHGIYRPR